VTTGRLGSEPKGESRVDDVVATAVLVVHIERLGEESIYRAGVNEVKKVMLDDEYLLVRTKGQGVFPRC
jgi:hypothetical protein